MLSEKIIGLKEMDNGYIWTAKSVSVARTHTLEEVNHLFLHAGQCKEGAEFCKNSSNSPVFRCVTELPETFDQEMLKNKKVSR